MITRRVIWWFLKRTWWVDRILITISFIGLILPKLHVHEPILFWIQIGFAVRNVATRHGAKIPEYKSPFGLFWWILKEAIFWPAIIRNLIRDVKAISHKE